MTARSLLDESTGVLGTVKAKADLAYVTGVGGLMAANVGLVLEGA